MFDTDYLTATIFSIFVLLISEHFGKNREMLSHCWKFWCNKLCVYNVSVCA